MDQQRKAQTRTALRDDPLNASDVHHMRPTVADAAQGSNQKHCHMQSKMLVEATTTSKTTVASVWGDAEHNSFKYRPNLLIDIGSVGTGEKAVIQQQLAMACFCFVALHTILMLSWNLKARNMNLRCALWQSTN